VLFRSTESSDLILEKGANGAPSSSTPTSGANGEADQANSNATL
jgi:hypothetical protein